ncbi:phosphatidylserine decarboxylase [Carboxylicivirga caseinilyticus]|uniref:phosphatidylserine decarboxylase n=1 Tax=Carboxylicivirga caseinilyticus TaxID=3417572 RepID=UPI003D354737|nr:phosphatidylserine decarboxylase [Marinilabiliaceae bacterium A049]
MIIVGLIVLLIVILFIVWRFWFFFRNPNRTIQYNENYILSPADGFIVYIRKVIPGEDIFAIKKGRKILLDELMFLDDQEMLNQPGWLIGICMGPFNVHYNRAPIEGYITKIKHDFPTTVKSNKTMFPALQNLFFNLYPYYEGCDYILSNERASYTISNHRFKVYVTQIADNWIRKIVTFRNKEEIKQGDVFGLIRMGSQVDLFIPDQEKSIEILVNERQKVRAGITILAKLND